MATASWVGIFRRGTNESETSQSQSMASRTSPDGSAGADADAGGGSEGKRSAAQVLRGAEGVDVDEVTIASAAAAGEDIIVVDGDEGEEEVRFVRESSSSSMAKR